MIENIVMISNVKRELFLNSPVSVFDKYLPDCVVRLVVLLLGPLGQALAMLLGHLGDWHEDPVIIRN